MAKSISNIVTITTTEITVTDIDSYFRNIAIVHAFEDADLVTGQTFSSAGYEEYETLDAVAVKFPTSSVVYLWAADAFAQKVNSGINGSTFEKLVIIQKKTTDTTYLSALTRVAYEDAYWVIPITDVVEEVESVYAWVSTKYMQMHTQDDSSNILDAGDDTDIASTLADATATRAAVWYHDDETEGLASSMIAILSTANPGDKAGFYKEPSNITVDTITDAGLTSLDNKYVNYYTYLKGGAGTYSGRNRTFNGTIVDGSKIQKLLQNDRILLTLQTRGMDVLDRDIPYDNRGVAELEGEIKDVLYSFQVNEIIKEQFFVDRNGNTANGYSVKVYTMEDTRTGFPSEYAAQKFVVEIDYLLALTAEKITIDIEFSV